MWSTSPCVTRIPAVRAPRPGELEPERRRVVPGIDHRCFRRPPFRSDDVAVRLKRSHHEAVDDKGHDERLSVGVYASAVQRWDLLAPSAPNGTRDPIVLHSDDGGAGGVDRASAGPGAGRAPGEGERLGDGRGRRGSTSTYAGGVVSGGPGTFMRFDAGERHTLRSETAHASCCCSRRGPARATTRGDER